MPVSDRSKPVPDRIEEAFDTRAAYLQAVLDVVASARQEICIFDPSLAQLELDSQSRSAAFAGFLAGSRERQARIVLHDLEHLVRHSPRTMGLLRRFSHSLVIRQTPDSLRHLADAFVLADRSSGVIRFHKDFFRGKMLLQDPEGLHDWQQRFEALWLESLPGVSATHLGL